MNIENYQMDWYERRDYVRDKAIDILTNDDDAFVEAVDELISWNGFIDTETFPMDMIDEICGNMKPSEVINKMTSDFDSNDDYFYFSIYGLESCDDKAELYRNETTVEEVLNALEEDYNRLYINNSELRELLEVLFNDDYGIDENVDIDEDMDLDDVPEETDDEFTERIDNIY